MNLITYPQTDEKVQMEDIVGGFVTKLGTNLQVYILANDNKWYLQSRVRAFGRQWVCDCFFGDANTPVGSSFIVAVVESDSRPKSPLDELFEEIVDYVRVERATPAP